MIPSVCSNLAGLGGSATKLFIINIFIQQIRQPRLFFMTIELAPHHMLIVTDYWVIKDYISKRS